MEYDLSKIKTRFGDDYFRLLSISDHLRELVWLYDNSYKVYKDKKEFLKKLTDLKILLDIEFEDKTDLIIKRIARFEEKMTSKRDIYFNCIQFTPTSKREYITECCFHCFWQGSCSNKCVGFDNNCEECFEERSKSNE
jgi:hypothetical protein